MRVLWFPRVVANCGSLGNPPNGVVTAERTVAGSQANYSCNEGYTLNGTTVRVCDMNGQWSENEPTCEGMKLIVYTHSW